MRHSYLFIIAIMLAVMTPRIAPAQSIAVKSNVLYDLTGTLNLGGEIRCDDTHSFNLSVNYNPWNLGENKKMKHILIQSEYRWQNPPFPLSFGIRHTPCQQEIRHCHHPQQEKIKTATLIIKIIRKQRYKQDACRILLLQ